MGPGIGKKIFPYLLSLLGSILLVWLIACGGDKLTPNGSGEIEPPPAIIPVTDAAPEAPIHEALLVISSTEGGSSTLSAFDVDSLELIENLSLGKGAAIGEVSGDLLLVTKPKLDSTGLPTNGREVTILDIPSLSEMTTLTRGEALQGGVFGIARDGTLGLTFVSIYHEGIVDILDQNFNYVLSKPAGVNPTDMAIDETNHRLFVVNAQVDGQGCGGTVESTVSAFQCDEKAEDPSRSCVSIGGIDGESTGGRNAVSIVYDPNRNWVIVAHLTDDNIRAWDVTGNSWNPLLNGDREEEKMELPKGAEPIDLTLDQDRLFVVNRGDDSVSTFELGTDSIAKGETIELGAGSEPTSAAVRTSGGRKTLFVGTQASVTVCDITDLPESYDCSNKITLGEGIRPTSVQVYGGKS